MGRTANEIVAHIREFTPGDGYWLPLDHLTAELWASGAARHYISDLLAVFERFPEESGEVLWGILHGIESLPGYEPAIVQSVRSRPSEMGVVMIGRLLNEGTSFIGSVSLVDLLQGLARQVSTPKRVREMAQRFIENHDARIQ